LPSPSISRRDAVVAVTIDLSEIKSREAELRQARETLEDAIEALNEGFVLFDETERFVMCNQRYREFNRKSADKLEPGVPRVEFLRAALERGQYPHFVGREDETLANYAKGGLAAALGEAFEFEQDDGRWFIGSNQRTRRERIHAAGRARCVPHTDHNVPGQRRCHRLREPRRTAAFRR
jgi:PAS domain-containing protein